MTNTKDTKRECCRKCKRYVDSDYTLSDVDEIVCDDISCPCHSKDKATEGRKLEDVCQCGCGELRSKHNANYWHETVAPTDKAAPEKNHCTCVVKDGDTLAEHVAVDCPFRDKWEKARQQVEKILWRNYMNDEAPSMEEVSEEILEIFKKMI